jgi:fatty acid desaturase
VLKQLIKQQGLLEKQPKYYTYKILFSLFLLGGGIEFLLLVNNFWLQLLDAIFLAFACGQVAFVCHDSGHRQIFHATRKNDLLFLLQANILLGMSYAWWLSTHNAHHSHPNELDMDPDISIPALCYSEEEARNRRGLWRFLAKYQAFFFFPFTLLVSIEFQRSSILFLMKHRVKYRLIEVSLLLLHYVLYFWLIFSLLNLWQSIVFILVHQAFLGLYLGTTFAPNHKGMPILEKNSGLDFLRRQVLTARNIVSHPIVDFCYAGLNYQVEHHLFPSMPRNNLKKAQRIIRGYCKEHSIIYYETSVLRSYREILSFLHAVGAPLR